MRIKFIKPNKYHKAGDIADVSPNVAFGLIDSGIAIISKDITSLDEEQANGKPIKLRTNKLK
jgi:hypothetical protein